VCKHREPQSINAKFFLPIIPIGIVAYAFTLLWDNLSRNSCIKGVENYPDLAHIIQHCLQGFVVKNIEGDSKEANDLIVSFL